MPRVYITRKLPEAVLHKLSASMQVEGWQHEELPVPREVLEQKVQNCDALLCLLTEQIDAALLAKANKLKVISNMAVGYNNIDVAEATRRGIAVTNTPGVLTETTADLTFGLLLMTARRLLEASEYLRAGEWVTWSPMQLTGFDVHGATLGIIGLGRIGEAVARRAKGFGMRVLYHNRSRNPEAEALHDLEYKSLTALLQESDYVVVLVPYTAETEGLIGAEELAKMKNTAILINTSRGGIVDEEALYEALASKRIWAAGLDVFKQEPVSLDHPLLKLPNVVALPHIGSASVQTRTRMAMLAADNLLAAVKGQRPACLVNHELYE